MQIDSKRSTVLGALAWHVLFPRLRLGERQVELIGVVLSMPASLALDAHPDDYRDSSVHGGKPCWERVVALSQNFWRLRTNTRVFAT
jgi:hypothetical protein